MNLSRHSSQGQKENMDFNNEYRSLVEFIGQGRAVLFLGSGANYSCQTNPPSDQRAPMGDALKQELSNKFLNGKFLDRSLAEVSEYAISQSSIPEVQEFVKELFSSFQPCPAQRRLTSIAWKGIATTNYDLIIEQAYEAAKGGLQKLQPVIDNSDDLVTLLKPGNALPYLKLHGCFSRMGPKDPPLVLSNDQYANYRAGRESVFNTLEEWAASQTIIFVGYSGQDQNIRQFVTHLVANQEFRPRYYFVKPHFDQIEINFWTSRRITPIALDFDTFIAEVDNSLAGAFRGILIETVAPTGLTKHFRVPNATLSANASIFVSKDCQFIADLEPGDPLSASSFYKGASVGWQWLFSNYDIDRTIVDELITEFVLIDDRQKPLPEQIVLLHGYAGSGKSVSLKRIAWEAAKEYDLLALYLRADGKLNAAAVREIIEVCKERVFLFIDDASGRVSEIKRFLKEIGEDADMLTVIMASRTNQWNDFEHRVDFSISRRFELGKINHRETAALLGKLEEHNALYELAKLPYSKRVEAFQERAGRELLVALHEATHGKSFEEIIVDEFHGISSQQARDLYLTICVMNRLGIGVRAGMISRLHGITFDRFKEEFFSPLENIVLFHEDILAQDMVYTARHRCIADMIFQNILVDQENRFEYYARVIGALNLSYSSDERGFRQMIRGRTLEKLFSDPSFVEEIYDQAIRKSGENGFLLHQKGIFEMNRPGANLSKATDLLERAAQLEPRNTNIQHSLGELSLKRAELARTPLEKEKHLQLARSKARQMLNTETTSHSLHTLAKVAIMRLKEGLRDGLSLDAPTFQILVKEAEDTIRGGIQRFPTDSHLLDARAQLAKLLNEKPRVIESLKTAFNANKKLSYLALQLYSCYLEAGDKDQAEAVLKEGLNASRGDRKLSYAYGSFIMDEGRSPDESLYYLRSAFVPGDSNYAAQIKFGRELFRAGRYEESIEFFAKIGRKGLGAFAGVVMYPLPLPRTGIVAQLGRGYIRVKENESKMIIYVKRGDITDETWNALVEGDRVQFYIGFNAFGPIGYDFTSAS